MSSLALAFENQVDETTTNQTNKGYYAGYTIVPNQVWSKRKEFNLSPGALNSYFKLLSMCYGKKRFCFPSQVYLAEEFSVTTKTIQRWLKELVNAGLLSVQHRSKGKVKKSNIYTLIDFENEQKLSTGDTQNVVPEQEVCDIEVPRDATPVSPKEIRSKNYKNTCMYGSTEKELLQIDDNYTSSLVFTLGKHRIDIESPRGQQYERLCRQENATPEQLDHALKVVEQKIKQGSVLLNEFGLAVSSIRQQKAGFVLVQPNYNSNGNQSFGLGSIEGKRTERMEFKGNAKQSKQQENEARQAKIDKYESFYL